MAETRLRKVVTKLTKGWNLSSKSQPTILVDLSDLTTSIRDINHTKSEDISLHILTALTRESEEEKVKSF